MNDIDYNEIIKQEYLKCYKSPSYFMSKYCYVQHPMKGKIKFNLFPFQSDTLTQFYNNRFNIIVKSRQMGISTLVAGYSLWRMIFLENQNILVIATKSDIAKNLITKIRVMYNDLPNWLKPKAIELNKTSISLDTGSTAKAVPATEDAGRSEALSLLIIDEAAHIPGFEDIWLAALSTLSTGGDCVMLSSPNGEGNLFFEMWEKAESGENNFNPIKLPWHLHPERDQNWRNEQEKELGVRGAKQECDCDFLSSGGTVVDIEDIKFYEDNHTSPPIEKRFQENLWIWEYPDMDKRYILSSDVARGDGKDFSAFHVLDIDTLTQVAEYKGLCSTNEYAKIINMIGKEYNEALVVVENANMGWAILDHLINFKYPKLYYSNKNSLSSLNVEKVINREIYKSTDSVPGFINSSSVRPLMIEKMENIIRNKEIVLRSMRLMYELKNFIYHPTTGRPEARSGKNDDLVMALCIVLWVRDFAIKLSIESQKISKAMVSNFYSSNFNSIPHPSIHNGCIENTPIMHTTINNPSINNNHNKSLDDVMFETLENKNIGINNWFGIYNK